MEQVIACRGLGNDGLLVGLGNDGLLDGLDSTGLRAGLVRRLFDSIGWWKRR